MRGKECIAMLLAGGEGRRLHPLTLHTAKPAVHFGGSYRMIDFALSNCSHSGISTIGVLTQFKPDALHNHIGEGTSWLTQSNEGEIALLNPSNETEAYAGTADAIYKNRDFIEKHSPEYVLVLSADHIYRMDYKAMLEQHKRARADATIAVAPVRWEEAHRFGILNVDKENRITRFLEKPAKPESNLASMGIYIFNWIFLKKLLTLDKQMDSSSHDFGKDIIPAMIEQGANIYSYAFKGYWKDVGTIESLWEANMDMLNDAELLPWQDKRAQVFTSCEGKTPQYVNQSPRINRSVVCNMASIMGMVDHSVISFGVQIGEGSMIEDSVIMPGAIIGKNTIIKKAIIGEGTYIGDGVILKGTGRSDIAVIGEKETIVTRSGKPVKTQFSSNWIKWISSSLSDIGSHTQ
jgi:glucose-1-phosphate adenylyltransferase